MLDFAQWCWIQGQAHLSQVFLGRVFLVRPRGSAHLQEGEGVLSHCCAGPTPSFLGWAGLSMLVSVPLSLSPSDWAEISDLWFARHPVDGEPILPAFGTLHMQRMALFEHCIQV